MDKIYAIKVLDCYSRSMRDKSKWVVNRWRRIEAHEQARLCSHEVFHAYRSIEEMERKSKMHIGIEAVEVWQVELGGIINLSRSGKIGASKMRLVKFLGYRVGTYGNADIIIKFIPWTKRILPKGQQMHTVYSLYDILTKKKKAR